jgi:predicted DNA-binding transcriptional regulator AlpA
VADENDWLDVQGVADLLGISRREALNLVNSKILGFPSIAQVPSTGLWRWRRSEVEGYRDSPPDLWTADMPWPSPEIPCRLAEPEEIPSGARSLIKATAPGWNLTATYARGNWPVRGKPGRVADSLVLRFRSADDNGDRFKGYGLWVDARFTGGAIVEYRVNRAANATQLRALLTCQPQDAHSVPKTLEAE